MGENRVEELRVWIDFEGNIPRKSNSREVFSRGKGGPPMVVKSENARLFIETALRIIPNSKRVGLGSNEIPLDITFYAIYQNNRADLSIELVLDALQQAGVISDDRYVFSTHAYKLFSKELQGVYCVIKEIHRENPRDFGLTQLRVRAASWADNTARVICEEIIERRKA